MALVLADRVRETTATVGTGTVTLGGAVTGYQSFAVVGNANTTYYCIAGQGTTEWEVGIGTYASAGTTLARTTVLASSNSGALVNFSVGTKDVFVTYPSEKSVNLDSSGLLTAPAGIGANVPTFLSVPSSANLAAAVTDGTGSGSLVFATSPTLTTPNLGTPSAVNLTNATALPLATAVSGTLGVTNGGTGLTSLTAHYIPYGNGTGAFGNSDALTYNGTIFKVGSTAAIAGTTNPIAAFTGAANAYVQTYIFNATAGGSSSADFVAYPDNGTDTSGWVDMGVTSSGYSDAAFTVTGPNESYLFGSAPSGASKTGNLVYATDSTGTANAHQWYVGGFNQAKGAWKMQLNSTALQITGNLGLGVTPSAWDAGINVYQINGGGFFASSSSTVRVSANTVYSGAAYKYISTANATYYEQSTGQHRWYNAPSGTAGAAITFTQAMTLDASGNLGIGKTSPATKLDVVGTVQAAAAATQDAVRLAGRAGGTSSYSVTISPTTLSASRTLTLPDADTTVVGTNATQTLTNKRIDPRTTASTTASTATLTPDISSFDQYNLTAQAVALTVAAPIGTPVDGNKLLLRILDNGTTRTISWNATYTVIGTTLPTATTAGKMLYVGCIYNSTNTRWDVVAVTTQA